MQIVSTAASTDNVQQMSLNDWPYLSLHHLWRVEVVTVFVRQSRIREHTYIIVGLGSHTLDDRCHLGGIERTVQTYGEHAVVIKTLDKVHYRLSEHVVSIPACHSEAHHYRQAEAFLQHHFLTAPQGNLGILYVEYCLYKHGIHATIYQSLYLLIVGIVKNLLVELRTFPDRQGLACRTDATKHITWLTRIHQCIGISLLPCQSGSFKVYLHCIVLQMLVGKRDALCIERICGDEV